MPRGNGRNKFISVNGCKKQRRICDGRARGGRQQIAAVEMKEQVGMVGSNKCDTGGSHSISFLEVPGNAKQKMEHYTSVLPPATAGTSALP